MGELEEKNIFEELPEELRKDKRLIKMIISFREESRTLELDEKEMLLEEIERAQKGKKLCLDDYDKEK